VLEALENIGEDRAGREGSRIALGQTASGRYLRVIYVPDPVPDSVFVITAFELSGKPLGAFRRGGKTRMKQPKLPTGWDESEIKRVLAAYEAQTEDEAVAEDELGVAPSDTVMNVPQELVPQVRQLIAKRQG